MANKKPTEEQASKEVSVDIKLNKTQIEALTCKANEVMYGGLFRATFHSNVSK